MRTSIPGYNKLVQPLQDLMEAVYAQAGGRTKRKTAKVSLSEVGWTGEHDKCLTQLKLALTNMVMLSHPDPNKRLCVYTDASESHWGAMVSQVPMDQVDRELASQDHEPLMFVSGTFSGAAKHWAIVEKEAYAILETCKRADYLLRRPGGFHLFTDHRNLQFIFSPASVVSTVPKYTADKLQRWAIVLMSYDYIIRHIPGEENVWADLLSRWGSPLASVCALVRLQPQQSPLLSDEFVWPSVKDLKHAQGVAKSNDSLWSDDLWKGVDGLWYTANEQVVIPEDADELKIRLLVVAHFSVGGHRGATVTADIVKKKFWWSTLDTDVKLFVSKCLHCASASGDWMHRPLGEALHADKPNELLHFDYVYMGKSDDGYEYLLVIKDDASKFVWLLPAKSADSGFVADSLIQWFASFGVCHYWVSDQGTHFKNQLIEDLQRVLGANHHFTTARCPWANGTVERAMREVLRCARVLLSEWQMSTTQWNKVSSVIQMVMNQSPLKSLGGVSPITAFTGLKPMSPIDKVVATVDEIKSSTLQELQESRKFNLERLQEAMENLHKYISTRSGATRKSAKGKQQGKMANFEIGDYVLYANVWTESKNKLLTKWNGPAMVTGTSSPWIYVIKNLVTGEEREAHASRLKFYADDSLELTGEFMSMVAHNSEGHVVSELKSFRFNKPKAQYEFLVSWRGLSEAEDSWEPAQNLYEDVPTLVKQFCSKLPQDATSIALLKSFKTKSFRGGSVVGPTTEASTNIEVIDALSVKKKVPNPRRAKRGQKLSGK
jgi:transposase InsO family protein